MIFLKLLIISIVILAASFAFLGIKMLLRNDSRFPEIHAGHNNEMRELGITCSRQTDIGCKPGDRLGGCPSCGKGI